MLAVVNTPSGPEPVAIRDIGEPAPKPNEALVAVHAFSLNRGELRLLQVRPEDQKKPKQRLEWGIGDQVRVIDGPLANQTGQVFELNVDQQKLTVLVNIFGRDTPVTLGFDQVDKL